MLRMYTKSRMLTGLVLLSTVAAPAAASAADLYRAQAAPPPAAYVPPVTAPNLWAGFYVGLNGGYASGNGGDVIDYNGGADYLTRAQPKGGFGGGQIGYNFQSGSFVYGVESDFQGASIGSSAAGLSANNNTAFTSRENIDWFGTVRGRLGWAFGPALLYGTGGFAYGNVNQRAVLGNDILGNNSTQTGYTVGGGIEYKFTPNWSVKAEYQYIDLGNEKLTDNLGAVAGPLDNSLQTVRAGLNYRFGGGGYEPLK